MALAFLALGPSACRRKSGDAAEEGPRPHLAIPPAHAVYVTNNGSDSLSVVDKDGERTLQVPIDVDPEAHEAPHHLARSPDGGYVFVALAFPPEGARAPKRQDPHGGHGASVSLGKLARLDGRSLTVRATREVDENPGDVALTHDGKLVLVTHYDMKRAMKVAAAGNASPSTMFARLQVWDAASLELRAQRPICVAPHGMAITADDRLVVVACYGSDELVVVDLTTVAGGTLATARYPLGNAQGVPGVPRYGPYSVALVPGSTRVLVASLEGNDLRTFDLATRKFQPEATVVLGAKAFMPAVKDEHTAYVPLQAPDSLARVNLVTAKVEVQVQKPADECRAPHAFALDGERLFLVCEGDHKGPGTLLELAPATLATLRKWTLGVYPDGLVFGR